MNEDRKDTIELAVCRTVGCTSWFAHWFRWPMKV